jgi:glycerophosphoryl diester phosphodiesterase
MQSNKSNIFNKITLNLFICFLLITSSGYALPSVIAHRGGGQNLPENILLSFSIQNLKKF